MHKVFHFSKMYKYIGGTNGNKKYALENVIGRGSFGKVYKCRRKSDGVMFAVKEIDIENYDTLR